MDLKFKTKGVVIIQQVPNSVEKGSDLNKKKAVVEEEDTDS